MDFYCASTKAPIEAANAAVYGKLRETIAKTDDRAVQADGSIIGRNAATDRLEPDATRTTDYCSTPLEIIGGWAIPVPEAAEIQLPDPTALGVSVRKDPMRWPLVDPEATPAWANDGVYTIGAVVTHNGKTWLHISDKQGEPDDVFDVAAMTGDWILCELPEKAEVPAEVVIAVGDEARPPG